MGNENNSGEGTAKGEIPKNKMPNDQILSGKISSGKISDGEVSKCQIFDGKILDDEILNGGDSDYYGEIVPAERVRGIFDRRKSGNKKMQILNFCREKETGEWQCKSLRHPRADEVRQTIGIDGDSPLLLNALERLLVLAKQSGPILITGCKGVGKKKFAEFFHHLVGGECQNLHILRCEEFASFPSNLTMHLRNVNANQLRAIAFDHPEFLPSETLKEIEKLFFSHSLPQTQPIFIVGLRLLEYFFCQFSSRVSKILQENMVNVPSLRERPGDIRRHALKYVSKFNCINSYAKRVSSNVLDRIVSCDYNENFHSLFALIETLYYDNARSGAEELWKKIFSTF